MASNRAVLDREHRVLLRGKRAGDGWNIVSIAAMATVVAVLFVGTWWTASAVRNGSMAGTLFRFSASSFFGAYYLVLYRAARFRHRFRGSARRY